MITKVVAGLVVLLVIGVGVILFPREENEPSSPTTSQTPTQPTSNSSVNQPATASYVDYSDGVIENTSGQKILFFHAPWCPQCRALESSIQKGPVPEGVTIIKVDYDSMQELRQKYGVTLQTTFVKIDDGGELVEKYVAYDKPNLDSVVENLL
jgi:thiol-disulfide isomerase/thioredoxin